ncbi:DUF2520 domain-containing protein [Rhodococcus sp. D2-41]|uniref:DUF2520 domain-containing protein n=1 Tax=Speluncibacter jeojiensis TaxID=2710754 RepID=A0A9X4RFD6_9ACTN|nr:DUF2520 domain-containing protein [Rhodococcus sp. D2-41]MDG3009303.1 DUF2520 domain-containing protein [Rhodococcus sp. D2-41]MDG3016910.1 DUF2520 domain-containing protein [Corynebacteriales bacterium D3-21]
MPGNWPTPARLTVGVVSAGRVGTALGEAWERAGHVVAACSAISEASRERAGTRLPESAILPIPEVVARAELLLLAVPDAELPGLIRGLASDGGIGPGKMVVHTAGAQGVGILSPLTELGAIGLAIHPAMTFTGHREDTDRLASACFGVTAADEVGHAIAQSLVIELGGEPVRIPERSRPLYHAALAHGSNHLVTLVNDAVAALRVAIGDSGATQDALLGADAEGVPQRILAPLLTAALDNALRYGDRALTGPVARGDVEAVSTHLRVLGEADPEIAAGYRALSLRTARRAAAAPELIALLEDQS